MHAAAARQAAAAQHALPALQRSREAQAAAAAAALLLLGRQRQRGCRLRQLLRRPLPAAAAAIRERDTEVDELYTSIFRELLTYMMEDPRNITACTHVLFMSKNLERIGDHATNIAETIYYIVRGKVPDDERAKGDLSSMTVMTDKGETYIADSKGN
jgi:Na+/phosphate symporter